MLLSHCKVMMTPSASSLNHTSDSAESSNSICGSLSAKSLLMTANVDVPGPLAQAEFSPLSVYFP